MTKKKVLLVHNFYQIGGGEHTVFENEKNMLLENGHEVYTYTRSNDELKSSKWKLLLMPLTTVWSFKSFFEVRKLIREQRIDVVHCHNTFPLISPSVYYAARSLKIPVVQTIHNFRFLCPNGLFYCNGKICEKCAEQNSFMPALKNKCYRNSKIQTAVAVAMLKFHRWIGTYRKINYIFLTEFNKSKFEKLIDIHGDNVFIKPNPVKQLNVRTEREVQKPKFIYASRLDRNKGIDFLLDVWPELPQEYVLHIYGDGEYRNRCEEMAEQYTNVRFFGFQSQKVIAQDMTDASAMLFLSDLYETFGMALAESFSIGKPVIATDVGNPRDILVASGGGAVYQCRNKESFFCAIEAVLRNSEQYSKCAEAYFQEVLTTENNYKRLCEIYENAKHVS